MSNALQTFMKFANIFGNPQEIGGGMPSTLPINPAAPPPLINRRGPSIGVPGAYDEPTQPPFGQQAMGGEDPNAILEMFKQSVMNPPKRTQMTYPDSTLNGLKKALEIAAEKTDYEKNRVYVDGHAYQQVKARKNPETGEIQYINKYKQPGFMEQVMKAMPASVSPAVDILNQPHKDAVADWEMRNKGLAAAANAEAQMALARQREANAAAIPERLQQAEDRLAISRLTAEERVRVSQLKTLTDEQLEMLRQSNKLDLATYNAVQAMKRVEAQQAGANRRTDATIAGANQRNAATIAGANQRNQNTIDAAAARQETAAEIESRHIRERAEHARTLKQTPGAPTPDNPYQRRIAAQERVEKFLNANPNLREYVEISPEGFPRIKEGTPDDYATIINEHITGPPQDVNLPVDPPSIPAPAPITALPGQAERDIKYPPKPMAPAPAPAAKPAPKQSGTVRVQAPNGQTGTWDLSKGPVPKDFKVIK